MKIKILLFIIVSISTLMSCDTNTAPYVITENLQFCESTLPYNGGILIANFGTEELNPLNNEGKGYIVLHKDSKSTIFIEVDGNLSAPKGMAVLDGYLFICDVNKIVVYNLNDKQAAPQIITFPEGDLFVNDIAIKEDVLYASVTNTGRIYTLDLANLNSLESEQLLHWADVPGANGLLIDNNKMYVASYAPTGVSTAENVVYVIENIKVPVPSRFIQTAGMYDGLALSADGETLYVSNWSPAGVFAIDIATREMSPVELDVTVGPADISIDGGNLYVPDLPNSKVLVVPVK